MLTRSGSKVRVWLAHDEDVLAFVSRRLVALGDFTPEEIERYGEILPAESVERARRSWASEEPSEP